MVVPAILAVIITLTMVVYQITEISDRAIVEVRTTEYNNAKTKLENIVDLVHSTAESRFEFMRKDGIPVNEAKELVKEIVRGMLWEKGINYVWINDMKVPYPNMVMHPKAPQLEGKVLSDPVYNCVKGTGRNFFSETVNVCRRNEAGFIEYLWPKTKGGDPKPKMMYVKESEALGWIFGSGIHIDQIDAVVQAKIDRSLSDIFDMSMSILYLALGMIVIICIVGAILSKRVISNILTTTNFFKELAEGEGDLTKRIANISKDELGEMNSCFNLFISKLNNIVSTVKTKTNTIDCNLVKASTLSPLNLKKNLFLPKKRQVK